MKLKPDAPAWACCLPEPGETQAPVPVKDDRGADLDNVRAEAHRLAACADPVRRKVGRVMLAAWASALGDAKVLAKLDARATEALKPGIAVSDERYIPVVELAPELATTARRLRSFVKRAQDLAVGNKSTVNAETLAFAFAITFRMNMPHLVLGLSNADLESSLQAHFAGAQILGRDPEKVVLAALRFVGMPSAQAKGAFDADRSKDFRAIKRAR